MHDVRSRVSLDIQTIIFMYFFSSQRHAVVLTVRHSRHTKIYRQMHYKKH
jgi:hypothetical protein